MICTVPSRPAPSSQLDHGVDSDAIRVAQAPRPHRSRRLRPAVFLFVACLPAVSAHASWDPTGPPGGVQITSMAVDPANPNHILAGTLAERQSARGLWASHDGGRTWAITTLSWNGIGYLTDPPQAIAFAPSDPSIVYVAARRLYRSNDGGTSWSEVNFPPVQVGFFGVAIDPHDPDVVYTFVYGQGPFRSRDGGGTWEPIIGGLSAPLPLFYEILVNPQNPSVYCSPAPTERSTNRPTLVIPGRSCATRGKFATWHSTGAARSSSPPSPH